MLLLIIEDIVTEKSLIHISFYSDLTISYFPPHVGETVIVAILKSIPSNFFCALSSSTCEKHSSAAFCVIQTNYCNCVSFFSFHYHYTEENLLSLSIMETWEVIWENIGNQELQ